MVSRIMLLSLSGADAALSPLKGGSASVQVQKDYLPPMTVAVKSFQHLQDGSGDG